MTAIQRMTQFLLEAPKWTPDRWDRTGPSFKVAPGKHHRTYPERNPGLKAHVLAQLQKGPATSDAIAKALKRPQQEVGAKLSKLYRDHEVERALTAISPHTGRRVLMYRLRNGG